jgi:hydroxyacylglutathione hydrolase
VFITPVSCLKDNYAYLIVDLEKSRFYKLKVGVAVVIDPVEPDKVLRKLKEIGSDIKLTHVLLTHKHYDHSGGNKSLLQEFPDLIVVGSMQDFPENSILNHYFFKVNKRVKDSEIFMVGRLCFRVLIAPCHTRGSVMYLLDVDRIEQDLLVLDNDLGQILDLDAPSLFSGDTLFTGGVGML